MSAYNGLSPEDPKCSKALVAFLEKKGIHSQAVQTLENHDTGDRLIDKLRSEWGEGDFNKVPGGDRDGRKKLCEPLYNVYRADKVKEFEDSATVISISDYSAYRRVHVSCETLQRISKNTRGVFGQSYSKKSSHKNRDKLFSNESIFLDKGNRDDGQWSKDAFKKKGDMADQGATRSIYWRDIYAPEVEEMPNPDYDCLSPDPVHEGINRQYLYIGGPGSLTPFHLENGSLESRNKLLLGWEKFWMLLSLEEAKKLGRKLHENCGLEPCALFHGPTWIFVHPDLLDEWGIQVTYIVQREGDIIDLHAYVLHAVLSNGLHVARAKNFASPKTATEDEVKLCECETTGRIPRSEFRFKDIPAEYEVRTNEHPVEVPVVEVHNNQDTSKPCGDKDIYNIETSEDYKLDARSRTGSPPSVTIKAASANQDNDRGANQRSFSQHRCKISDIRCGGTFCSESGRQEPIKTKHKAATICCKYAECDKTFSSKQGLCNHNVQVHQQRKRMCSDCRKEILVKNFKRHRKIHARDQKVTCNKCGRTMNFDNIVKHLKRCEGTIVCKSCCKVFKSNQGKSSHKCN